MKNQTTRTAALMAILAMAACGGGIDVAPKPTPADPIILPDLAQQPIVSKMDKIINDTRAEYDLPAVRRSTKLNAAARTHASDMSKNDFFSHASSNGDDIGARVANQGYKSCYAAENIAWGQKTETEVFRAWMLSDDHRKNILSEKTQNFGFVRVSDPDGSHDPLWVMVFGATDC